MSRSDDGLGISLGKKGRVWVAASLSDGLAISEAVLATDTLDSWEYRALVPADTPPSVYERPEYGGVGYRVTGLHLLLAFFERFLLDETVLIAEDELFSPDDEWVREQGGLQFNAFVYETRLYHWLTLRKGISIGRLSDFLDESTSGYPTNMFLLNVSESARFAGDIRTGLAPSQIATNVDVVIVGAYDDEAYIAGVRRGG
jgi:hypothetical protein